MNYTSLSVWDNGFCIGLSNKSTTAARLKVFLNSSQPYTIEPVRHIRSTNSGIIGRTFQEKGKCISSIDKSLLPIRD